MFFIITFLILILGRANSSLLGFEILNPDETQMIANAIGIASRDYNIVYFDGNSSGVFNSLILVWPKIFGLDITFLTTRISAIILLSLIIFLTFRILKQNMNNSVSYLLILPLIIFFSFTKDPDFLHYSSELLSTFIIILSYWLFIKFEENNSKNFFYFLIPVILSFIFFSKIQFAPVALTIFSFMLIVSFTKDRLSLNFFVLIFSFFLTPIILLSIYYSNNSLNDFFINYFQYPRDYITIMNENNVSSLSGNKEDFLKTSKNIYFNHLILNSALHYFYIFFLLFLIIFFIFLKRKTIKGLIGKNLILNLLVIFSLLFSILIPGRNFRHYLISIMPFVPIFFSLLINFILTKKFIKKNHLNSFLIFLTLVFSFSLFFEDKKFYSKKFDQTLFKLDNINFKNPKLFQYLKINEKENIYIWGWMPKWYIIGGYPPASRSTISEKLIEENNYKKYYRKRLIKDLYYSSPSLIIDFVRPKSFKHTLEKDKLEKFEELNNITQKSYIKLNNKNSKCPTYYLSFDSYSKFKKKNINYFFNKERYSKINDFSITEDICDDKYNFSNSDEDKLSLNFIKPEKVKDIYILSSKVNSSDSYLELEILNKKNIIYKTNLLLKKYPYWSKLELKTGINADGIVINVKNLKIDNYGINEIKIYKK